MSENIAVVDWFTKKRKEVKYPEESDKALEELIEKIIPIFNEASKLSKIADNLFETYKENELLKNISSDSRLPICSLFHHLKNTSGIAVCLALQNMEKDQDFIKKAIKEYGISVEYQKQDFISLVRIAALLHDIGKPRSYTSSRKGQLFYYHTKQTEEILEYILSRTKSELAASFELKKILPLLAARHHSRDATTSLEKMLSLADTVASAADRIYEVESKLVGGKIEVTSKDRIFPHEINFDEGGLKCLETPHTEILGNGSHVSKNVQLKTEELGIQLFRDSIVRGGSIEYLGNSKKLTGKIGIFSLDIMGIQSFINEADELKMLRGGSFIVSDTLNKVRDIIAKEICEEAVLFAGGGNLLAFIPDREDVMGRLESKIKQEIKEISKEGMNAAVVTFNESLSTVAGNFNVVLKKSQDLLEVRKNESRLKPFYTDSEKICKHCSKRPEKSGGICEVCKTKEKEGMEQKSSTGRNFIKKTYGLKRPTQVSEIGDSIAVLAVDGNMMGRMFQQTMTPAEYTYKSEIFGFKFEQILESTINEFLENEEKRHLLVQNAEGTDCLGIDILYAGGDDILMIINARAALQFAQALTSNIAESFAFEKQFHNKTVFKNYIVTTSCGIAIADSKFPIYFLLEAAREMESKAKEAFRKNTEINEFGIIHIPKGSIAVTAISSAMPRNSYNRFVLEEEVKVQDAANLNELNELSKIIDFELLGRDRGMVSDIITCGDSELEKLNLIKYMYSSLPRKTDRLGLEECEWMTDILLNSKVIGAAKMIIPHLRKKAEEV